MKHSGEAEALLKDYYRRRLEEAAALPSPTVPKGIAGHPMPRHSMPRRERVLPSILMAAAALLLMTAGWATAPSAAQSGGDSIVSLIRGWKPDSTRLDADWRAIHESFASHTSKGVEL
jgi:hypothetical protein